jgi:hypothetical protein
MVRRDRRRAAFRSALAELIANLAAFSWWRHGRVEDLNDHMLRDIGFFDGRATEAAMRRAAGYLDGSDRF